IRSLAGMPCWVTRARQTSAEARWTRLADQTNTSPTCPCRQDMQVVQSRVFLTPCSHLHTTVGCSVAHAAASGTLLVYNSMLFPSLRPTSGTVAYSPGGSRRGFQTSGKSPLSEMMIVDA